MDPATGPNGGGPETGDPADTESRTQPKIAVRPFGRLRNYFVAGVLVRELKNDPKATVRAIRAGRSKSDLAEDTDAIALDIAEKVGRAFGGRAASA